MPYTVFIDGAAGTTGLEIAERLADRSEFTPIILDDDKRKSAAARAEALNDADFAILCLPDEAAREAVALLDPAKKTRVIDASSAHRVASGWVYGFPEIVGAATLAEATHVSNPGCYPTGFLALIVPLIRARLLPANWPYTVHAVSGYSGGGKSLIERFTNDPDISWRAYGLAGGHKHITEMQSHSGLAFPPVFSPAVIPAHRGMVLEIPLPIAAIPAAKSADELRDALMQFYADSRIVSVSDKTETDELLLRRSAQGSDRIELFVFASSNGDEARLVATLDNLGKGASGAAIQSLNLMAGLDETIGLRL